MTTRDRPADGDRGDDGASDGGQLARVRDAFTGREIAEERARSRFREVRLVSERRALTRLVRRLPPGPRLDLPCGTGTFADSVVADATLFGADGSPDMAAVASRNSAYRGVFCGDAARLPVRDRALASAVMIRLLHHLDTGARRAVLQELRRVVDGPAIVSFYDSGTLEGVRGRFRKRASRSRRSISLATLTADAEATGWHIAATSRKVWRLTQNVYVLLSPR